MSSDLKTKRLAAQEGETVTFLWQGQAVEARAGDSLAAALLAAGIASTRTTALSHSPRGPFCMMGACYECLVELEEEPGRVVQACMTPVAEGMKVRAHSGPTELLGQTLETAQAEAAHE